MTNSLAHKGRETLGAGALPQVLDAELPTQLRSQVRREFVLKKSAATLIVRAGVALDGVATGMRLETSMFTDPGWI